MNIKVCQFQSLTEGKGQSTVRERTRIAAVREWVEPPIGNGLRSPGCVANGVWLMVKRDPGGEGVVLPNKRGVG